MHTAGVIQFHERVATRGKQLVPLNERNIRGDEPHGNRVERVV